MNVLYFSTVNWKWIKQRPHFICEYISKKNIEVMYFSITPLFKQKISKYTVNRTLEINDRFVIPYASRYKLIKEINKLFVKRLLKKKFDIVVLTHPEQIEYLPNNIIQNSKIIYECMDNMPYFYSGKQTDLIEKKEYELCRLVDTIITSSKYLKERIVKEYKIDENKITIIKNAFDKSILDNDIEKVTLKYPSIVYVGTISEWLDIDMILEYAKKHSEHYIYMVGPTENKIKTILSNYKNIILVGAVEHKFVKTYIESGNIMLIPFKINELIKGVDPVKIYEYLALGKTVVTSYWEELDSYNNNAKVKFYSNFEEFEELIESNIQKELISGIPNKEFIIENTWEDRALKYIEVLYKTRSK